MTKTTPTTSVGLKLVLDPLWLMESEGYRPRWAHFLVAAQSKPISRKIPQLRSRIKLCWNSQVFEWRSNYVLILENQSFQCDHRASLEAETLKNLPAMQETQVLIPGSGRSSGGGHSNPLQHSCLAWKILWTERPGVTKTQKSLAWLTGHCNVTSIYKCA